MSPCLRVEGPRQPRERTRTRGQSFGEQRLLARALEDFGRAARQALGLRGAPLCEKEARAAASSEASAASSASMFARA
ncbi:MAG: hypothetical protein ACJ754_21615 [Pyrinomonadaceae bacterium]